MDAAALLRKARRDAGLSQTELARRAGTSQATVSQYETGRKVPSMTTFSRVLAAAGSRVTVAPALQPVIQPTAREWARVAVDLPEVLALAEALPWRPDRRLRFPRLRSAGAGSK